MQLLPLQVPGAMELFVILLIFVILAIPVLLVLGLLWYLRRRSDDRKAPSQRIRDLEARVAELESLLEEAEMGEDDTEE